MFFNKKLLIGIIAYIALAFIFSSINLVSWDTIIYVEELKKIGVFDFAKSFYINIVETLSSDTKTISVEAFVVFLLKFLLAGFFLNFTYVALEKSQLFMILSYLIIMPFALYGINLYLINYDYVVFHYNNFLFFMSFSLGFAIAKAWFNQSYVNINFSDISFTFIGISIIYYLANDEFQSTLAVVAIFVLFIGLFFGIFHSILNKKKNKKEEKIEKSIQ